SLLCSAIRHPLRPPCQARDRANAPDWRALPLPRPRRSCAWSRAFRSLVQPTNGSASPFGDGSACCYLSLRLLAKLVVLRQIFYGAARTAGMVRGRGLSATLRSGHSPKWRAGLGRVRMIAQIGCPLWGANRTSIGAWLYVRF